MSSLPAIDEQKTGSAPPTPASPPGQGRSSTTSHNSMMSMTGSIMLDTKQALELLQDTTAADGEEKAGGFSARIQISFTPTSGVKKTIPYFLDYRVASFDDHMRQICKKFKITGKGTSASFRNYVLTMTDPKMRKSKFITADDLQAGFKIEGDFELTTRSNWPRRPPQS